MPSSIFTLLSGFFEQKGNYGLLYMKVLICYYGEGQRASFMHSLHWSQRSMWYNTLHFFTFKVVHFLHASILNKIFFNGITLAKNQTTNISHYITIHAYWMMRINEFSEVLLSVIGIYWDLPVYFSLSSKLKRCNTD